MAASSTGSDQDSIFASTRLRLACQSRVPDGRALAARAPVAATVQRSKIAAVRTKPRHAVTIGGTVAGMHPPRERTSAGVDRARALQAARGQAGIEKVSSWLGYVSP